MKKRAPSGERRKTLPSHARLPPAPSSHLHHKLASSIVALPNVVGTYLGRKRRGGRWLKQSALVVIVRDKLPAKQLAERERVPKQVTIEVSPTVRVTMATDVIVHEPFQLAATASPGDPTVPAAGIIGAALEHPDFGIVVTTAGHVYSSLYPIFQEWPSNTAPAVSLSDRSTGQIVQGQLRKVVRSSVADYALVVPTTAISSNTYDGTLLGGPYTPDLNDIGGDCSTLQSDMMRGTKFEGVNTPIDLGSGATLNHAIVTTRCTSDGDSGCCLVDGDRRIVGLLVGFSGSQSAFMPITRVLADENATLV